MRDEPTQAGFDARLGTLRLREIRSFVVLSEELHFARAAERLALTPGGLSRRIARLEKALGAMLLHRTTRHVGLTPYGMQFAPAARRLMDQVDALPGGPVRIAGGVERQLVPGSSRPDKTLRTNGHVQASAAAQVG